ncbi:hypothetical protein [Acaryochloris marina]|uniref:Uncharacterized protein n=1 Tax=Acaryochloris marina (strain MBIC 11017) TaxID=329726 RepID=A8ZQM8_ACAM1|nr:hypothetical protein [Acaryochloris marina]ABW33314.1 hypothetical protein AM1_G0134 [Acaryochloris marina MBIC11017]
MESDEIIIRYYHQPKPVMVDPGKSHPCYEPDLLLGWICKGDSKKPVLKKFPDAEIVAKVKPDTKPKTRTKLRRIQ